MVVLAEDPGCSPCCWSCWSWPSSLTFFLLNQTYPDQISGLGAGTDALYFTLSTMTTVGFGDIHAEGQFARALVCVLLVFNVVVVAR